MGYASLAHCVKDLEQVGALKRIEVPLDPNLEVSALQRLVFKAKGPALLLTQVKDCPFPILTNLFGTKERLHYLFRNELPVLEDLFKL
ncbi:MAG: UbiD family decarboxylase [Desulfovibrionaceae bacterium]|nr:UbiD family decarboxylase [Desulfovibrionaceae bacterium]